MPPANIMFTNFVDAMTQLNFMGKQIVDAEQAKTDSVALAAAPAAWDPLPSETPVHTPPVTEHSLATSPALAASTGQAPASAQAPAPEPSSSNDARNERPSIAMDSVEIITEYGDVIEAEVGGNLSEVYKQAAVAAAVEARAPIGSQQRWLERQLVAEDEAEAEEAFARGDAWLTKPSAVDEFANEEYEEQNIAAEFSGRAIKRMSIYRLPEMQSEELVPTISVTLVAIYMVIVASDTGRYADILLAFNWILAGLLILFFEVSVLMGLAISNNWLGCNADSSNCGLGAVCVQVQGSSGIYRRPYCVDCYYLSDSYGYDDPWTHSLVAERGVNATAACVEQLLDPTTMRYWVSERANDQSYQLLGEVPANLSRTPSFDTCLYARAARENQTFLDVLIMFFAFTLLAVDNSLDATEHSRANFLRKCALRVCLPNWKSARSWLHTVACLLVKLIDIGFSTMVPGLLPCALLMMLLALGSSSTNIILNGLAVGFVLEIDNRIPQAFLSLKVTAELRERFRGVIESAARREEAERRRRASRLTHGLSGERLSRTTFQAPAATTGAAIAAATAIRARAVATSASKRAASLRKLPPAKSRESRSSAPAPAALPAHEFGMRTGMGMGRTGMGMGRTGMGMGTGMSMNRMPTSDGNGTAGSAKKSATRLRVRDISTRASWQILKHAARPLSQVRLTDHPAEAYVRFVTTMIAFVHGFYRTTEPDSGIRCEMLLYFFYYRICITFAVWLTFAMREVVEGCSTISYWAIVSLARLTAAFDSNGNSNKPQFRSAISHDFNQKFPKWAWESACSLLVRFLETLTCTYLMHIIFWVYCSVYWDNELDVAFRYLGPFLEDPFGSCAASGYRYVWGLPCIP